MQIQRIQEFIRTGKVDDFSVIGPNHRFAEESLPVSILIPGHVYTFISSTIRGNDDVPSLDDFVTGVSKGKKPYIDNRPIFISLGQEGPFEIGLNLKVIPQGLRRTFIRTYFRALEPILKNLTDSKGEFIEYPKRIRLPEMNPFGRINKTFITSISQFAGIKFEFLVDKYKREEMRYLGLIDWPQVHKIGEIDYSRDPAIATRSQISDFLK